MGNARHYPMRQIIFELAPATGDGAALDRLAKWLEARQVEMCRTMAFAASVLTMRKSGQIGDADAVSLIARALDT